MPDQDTTLANSLTKQFLKQHKRDRFWRNVRFLLGAAVIIFIFTRNHLSSLHQPSLRQPNQPYVSLLRLTGEISSNSPFSAKQVVPELNRAFADQHTKGVVLDINSPGGSPVQASIIHDRIIALKHRYPQKKVAVIGEDSLASGAYLVAVAADKIFVNPSTVTGSIGVIMRGFGFKDAMQKIGVSRRVFSSGRSKARLDAFSALKPQDIKKVHQVLDEVHRIFIADVLLGRSKQLHGDQNELFSGDFWTGSTAVKLGLADGTANLWQVLAQVYKVHQYKDYTPQPSLLDNAFKGLSTELNLHYRAETAPQLSEDL